MYLGDFVLQDVAQRCRRILHPQRFGELHHRRRMLLAELSTVLVPPLTTAGLNISIRVVLVSLLLGTHISSTLLLRSVRQRRQRQRAAQALFTLRLPQATAKLCNCFVNAVPCTAPGSNSALRQNKHMLVAKLHTHREPETEQHPVGSK